MDHKQAITYRFENYGERKSVGQKKYDYGKNGLIHFAVPNIILRGNPTLVAFLQMVDVFLIYLFKTVESMQKFKTISRY